MATATESDFIGLLPNPAAVTIGDFRLLCLADLDSGAQKQVVQILSDAQSPELKSNTDETIIGRGAVHRVRIGNYACVVRKYLRGGWMQHLSHDRFFSMTGKRTVSRPEQEFQILRHLHAEGLPVPLPVVCATKFLSPPFFYNGFIATVEIPDAENLLQLALTYKGSPRVARVLLALQRAGEVTHAMLSLGVSHSDLHLGNILLDSSEGVWLIDFDKARVLKSEAERARAESGILERFQRSVEKHGLPIEFASTFRAGVTGEPLFRA